MCGNVDALTMLCFLVFIVSLCVLFFCRREQRWTFASKKTRSEKRLRRQNVCLWRVTHPKMHDTFSLMNLEPLRQSEKTPSDFQVTDDWLVLGRKKKNALAFQRHLEELQLKGETFLIGMFIFKTQTSLCCRFPTPLPSCVSLKSDYSRKEPLSFNNEPAAFETQ